MTPIKTVNSNKNIEQQNEKSLEVYKGSKSIFINHNDIGIIHLSDRIVWITTINNETYQTSFSLTELSNKLSSSIFFRLNRQGIISRKIIKGYNRIGYQKLEILIDNNFPSELNLVVSKYNAPNFKKWLTN
ncbi:LytTR family transcriptional regulator DNA-binding domain-containing protein [Marixanthomonas sp. SCSIO 43207]|uniref:LytTR family DNA-binding domain-containing protein n=1 Tax=Marixanthomonas sp. SCSIO 43207 TaxID=2779360 RepID=UPI001CAA274E|nr:LytTR family DNA-binding domain-containing protein [Marixanthomonas sp. SCSIO 43207]UAB82264.1 LytTR family transcriptional regulator DNA-binding domain-containing protein [Marixanthomonas sp. SCSIO 43207]